MKRIVGWVLALFPFVLVAILMAATLGWRQLLGGLVFTFTMSASVLGGLYLLNKNPE